MKIIAHFQKTKAFLVGNDVGIMVVMVVTELSKRFLTCIFITLFCCEYLMYNVVIYQCSWPLLEQQGGFRNGKFIDKSQNVKAIFLSDPHLLGSKYGHWFDKLRREWQMRRSFQTAMNYFQPEVVFILGDIFDEGMICNDEVSRATLTGNLSEVIMFQNPLFQNMPF